MKPKIIHTKAFSCADDHPIVYYTVDENNEAVCEYCSAKFIYQPEKTPSEEIQDELEPIPMSCPIHEDYDEEEITKIEKDLKALNKWLVGDKKKAKKKAAKKIKRKK